MKQPSISLLAVYAFALASTLLNRDALAEVPEELAENWYRTEILIFVRESADSRLAEQWDPLPTLEYPERYRYLLDPKMADRRVEESLAYESAIDARGTQILKVPAPIEELLDHSRPDALTTPLTDLDLLAIVDDADPNTADALNPPEDTAAQLEGGLSNLPNDPNGPNPDLEEPQIDLTSPIVSLPYVLLDNRSLEFRAQARSLRRQGNRIAFHGSWWAQLNEANETPALIMDRSGDIDSLDWPALQGSLQVYRSRYLHIALDLWLNTLGEYLPEAWQIDPPPLSPSSLVVKTLGGREMNPWAPVNDSALLDTATDPLLAQSPASSDPEPPQLEIPVEEESIGPEYPWRHAIVHRQTRRMRSGEIHYLDHPVVGVIIKVTPMSEEALPLLPPEEREFRERHALPIELLPIDDESAEDEDI
ncbi:CsiV family protein [Congregibacter sp.]|uniref:CsiV family protein n=1 Tax=Congregibacter sp. TaxID=2744308 RepID=UPI003F6A6CE7